MSKDMIIERGVAISLDDRAAQRLDAFPLADVLQPEGQVARTFASQVQRVKLFALVELLGFFIIFTCMILMRFGL